jgi:putative transposase
MPWRDTSPMDQRTQFIADHLRGSLSITELCALYGVSRKTGYKWIDRYLRHGPAGLEERSRRPRHSPRHTSEEIVTAILDARRRHPRWGGKKLLALLHKRHPRWVLPGRSTACDILSRHGMVPPSGASVAAWAIRASRPARFSLPTTSGVPTTRASSGRAMGGTAIR